jgi:hypothetical protein
MFSYCCYLISYNDDNISSYINEFFTDFLKRLLNIIFAAVGVSLFEKFPPETNSFSSKSSP